MESMSLGKRRASMTGGGGRGCVRPTLRQRRIWGRGGSSGVNRGCKGGLRQEETDESTLPAFLHPNFEESGADMV